MFNEPYIIKEGKFKDLTLREVQRIDKNAFNEFKNNNKKIYQRLLAQIHLYEELCGRIKYEVDRGRNQVVFFCKPILHTYLKRMGIKVHVDKNFFKRRNISVINIKVVESRMYGKRVFEKKGVGCIKNFGIRGNIGLLKSSKSECEKIQKEMNYKINREQAAEILFFEKKQKYLDSLK